MRSAVGICGLAAVPYAMADCSIAHLGPPETSICAPDTISRLIVKDSGNQATGRFKVGQQIRFQFDLENISSRAVEYCVSGFSVMILDTKRRVVWTSRWGEIEVQGCSYRPLSPGESWTQEVSWDQSKIDRSSYWSTEGQVTPGEYLVIATFAGESATRRIVIEE